MRFTRTLAFDAAAPVEGPTFHGGVLQFVERQTNLVRVALDGAMSRHELDPAATVADGASGVVAWAVESGVSIARAGASFRSTTFEVPVDVSGIAVSRDGHYVHAASVEARRLYVLGADRGVLREFPVDTEYSARLDVIRAFTEAIAVSGFESPDEQEFALLDPRGGTWSATVPGESPICSSTGYLVTHDFVGSALVVRAPDLSERYRISVDLPGDDSLEPHGVAIVGDALLLVAAEKSAPRCFELRNGAPVAFHGLGDERVMIYPVAEGSFLTWKRTPGGGPGAGHVEHWTTRP